MSELTLSHNPNITAYGWSKILVAVAVTSDLKYFHIDYNLLDDSCGYLIIAILSSNKSLEVLDLEKTGITNKTALLLLYLVKNYKLNNLKSLNLLNNPIDANILLEIKQFVKNEYDFDNNSINSDTIAINTNIINRSDGDNEKINEKKILKKSLSKNKVASLDVDNMAQINDIDLQLRDQLKLEEYLHNANKFNNLKENINDHRSQKNQYQRELDRLEYQRALEKNYSISKARYDKWRENDKFINEKMKQSNDNENYETAEILKPYDDLRFKNHSVLPFNIVRY